MEDRVARFIERMENRHWGKYRGIVVDRADPEQLGRLKLQVPSLLADAVTGWAWPASPYAGAGIGLFAIPQKDDLVWVEFLEGELDHPIWSGAAWAKPGGTSEVPEEARDSYPDQVVLKTASGNVVILADASGNEQIVVRAASGTEVILDPNAKRITIQADEVVVRGASGSTAEELATKSFVQNVFDQHTHGTGVGPSGPPLMLSGTIPHPVTTVLKAE
jgi:uncharacterized protein involved in type VI secretion and phage assembly